MSGDKDDGLGLGLRLGLGLGCQENRPFPLLAPPSLPSNRTYSSSAFPPSSMLRKSSIFDAFQSPGAVERDGEDKRSYLPEIDDNRPAVVGDRECEEVGISSPNSTVSSVSGKRELENEADRPSSSLEDDGDGDEAAKKKLRLSREQSAMLEETFKEHSTLNSKDKLALAKQLNLSPRQVEVWFQNRRARTKLKQTEVDCEYLRQCCDNLTEENRRLQREVKELRALKLSPQFYMNMNPPTTLTMCPSCECVAVSSSSASAATRHINAIAPPRRHSPVSTSSWAAAVSPH